MATTLTSTGITFNDASIQASASPKYSSITGITSTGTFTVPTGITELVVIVVGGGGGGGGYYTTRGTSRDGGDGGGGGIGVSKLTVSPGQIISCDVGAGGTGTNSTTNGTTGGTSEAYGTGFSIVGTGGIRGLYGSSTPADGADGTSSGGNIGNSLNSDELHKTVAALDISMVKLNIILDLITQREKRPNGASSTGAIAYTLTGSNRPGAGGSGETGSSSNASGGVNGAVIFIY